MFDKNSFNEGLAVATTFVQMQMEELENELANNGHLDNVELFEEFKLLIRQLDEIRGR